MNSGTPAEGVGIVDGGPRLPDGEYVLEYQYQETAVKWGNPKIAVHFCVVEPQDLAGVIVTRWYNAKELLGPPRKGGNFSVGARSKAFRDFSVITGSEGKNVIEYGQLEGRKVRARLRTTKTDGCGRNLESLDHYSVVDEILGPADDPN